MHSTNLRLRVHLALLGDWEQCSLQVGQEELRWQQDELLLLDTTLQHSARNEGQQDRYVLLFDIWHPALSKADIEALKRLDAAFDH